MKKIYYIPILLLTLTATFLLVKYNNNKCIYPIFDLNHGGQVFSACFQASSFTHHQHKDSVMVEIVAPSASSFGENIFFENKREMALFVCQIFFKSQNKRPTRYDSIASNPLPGQKIIKAKNHSLFASDSGQSSIIDRLFCVADK